jgi:hypothetical protein
MFAEFLYYIFSNSLTQVVGFKLKKKKLMKKCEHSTTWRPSSPIPKSPKPYFKTMVKDYN